MTTIETLQTRKSQIEARLRAAQARERLQRRRDQDARCYLVGRFFLKFHSVSAIAAEMKAEGYLRTARDYHLMGLDRTQCKSEE